MIQMTKGWLTTLAPEDHTTILCEGYPAVLLYQSLYFIY